MTNTTSRRPWIGDAYRSGGVGLKLFGLGESHYGEPEEAQDPDFTRKWVRHYIEGGWKHRYYTMIASIVLGIPGPLVKRADFWNSVAFWNYVPNFMSGPGVSPLPSDWIAGAEQLPAILRELVPTHMIILGQRLYVAVRTYNPEFVEATPMRFAWGEWPVIALPRNDGSPLLATWIKHPSRANRAEWHEVVARFLLLGTEHQEI